MANDALGIRVIEFPLEATEEDLNASSKVLVDTPQGTKALDGDILGSLAPSIAKKFNKNKSYEDGDVVMHRGALRRFKGPHQGDWTDSDNDATDVVALIEEASTQYVVFPCSPEDLPDGDIIKGVVDAGLHPALKFSESANITYLPLTANYTRSGKEFLVFASGPFNISATKNLESDSSEWEWSNKCPSDLRTAALETIAPSFKSRSENNYTWEEGEVCVYDDGHLYVFIKDHEGPWDDEDVEETTLAEVTNMAQRPTVIVKSVLLSNAYTYANDNRNVNIPVASGNPKFLTLFREGGALDVFTYEAFFETAKKLRIKRARIITPGSSGLGPAKGNPAAVLCIGAFYTDDDTDQTIYGEEFAMNFTYYNEWQDFNLVIDNTDFGHDYFGLCVKPSSSWGGVESRLTLDDFNLQAAYKDQSADFLIEFEIEEKCIYNFK